MASALQNPIPSFYNNVYTRGTYMGYLLGTRLTVPDGGNLQHAAVVAYSGTDSVDFAHRTGHGHRNSCVPARLGKRVIMVPSTKTGSGSYQYA